MVFFLNNIIDKYSSKADNIIVLPTVVSTSFKDAFSTTISLILVMICPGKYLKIPISPILNIWKKIYETNVINIAIGYDFVMTELNIAMAVINSKYTENNNVTCNIITMFTSSNKKYV